MTDSPATPLELTSRRQFLNRNALVPAGSFCFGNGNAIWRGIPPGYPKASARTTQFPSASRASRVGGSKAALACQAE